MQVMARALIIEDNRSIAELEKRHLERDGFEVLTVSTGNAALELVGADGALDILIIDYNLPDMSGVEIMQKVKGMGLSIPSIIVTAAGSEAIAVAAMKLGAMDYIVKDRDTIKALPATCRDVLRKFDLEGENARLLEELKHLNEELRTSNLLLEDLSRKDDLTGVYNRRFLMESLGLEAARAHRYGQPLSLAIFDIDHFKRVNDTNGHLMGDTVLRQFASTMQNRLRKTDVFGRYGGEEFAVIITATSLAPAAVLCEELRRIVETTPFGDGETSLSLTASAGVAEFKPGMDIDALMDTADRGLYRAKEEGRNRVASVQDPT
jgi:diguanylate cyclase (GGDEF)-like protein